MEYISREAAIKALQPTHAPAINEVLASVLRRVPAADVVERPRWIPVAERLPDIGSNCLIFSISGWVAEGQFDGDGWTQYRWSAKFDKDAVTHWVPLPEPPKEEE